jgi:hypothetical protein
MREVVVETIGKGERTIQVGIDWDNIKKMEDRYISSASTICSPRISPQPAPWDCKSHTDTKCWKTTKRGNSHAKKNWQRHPDRKPSRRRARWGHFRGYIYPSVRNLNKMGRCIYPNIGG